MGSSGKPGTDAGAAAYEQRLDKLRRYGLVLLGAFVLLPPLLVVVLVLGVGGLYMAIKAVQWLLKEDEGDYDDCYY